MELVQILLSVAVGSLLGLLYTLLFSKTYLKTAGKKSEIIKIIVITFARMLLTAMIAVSAINLMNLNPAITTVSLVLSSTISLSKRCQLSTGSQNGNKNI